MNRNRVQFVIAGAFALHEHTGIWRDTKDLDFFLPAKEVPRALQVLAQDGFQTQVLDTVWLAKARRGDFFVDLITGMSNAVIRVDYSWIKRALLSEVLGIPVRVLAPEELIASKVFVTRRERFDGADICHVIYGTKGKLDWKHLLHLMGEHWEMLLWCLVLLLIGAGQAWAGVCRHRFAVVNFLSAVFVLVNLLTDVAYAKADPRVTYS